MHENLQWDLKDIISSLKEKIVIFSGKDIAYRYKLIEGVKRTFSSYKVYNLPKGIRNLTEYYEVIRTLFPIVSPLGAGVSPKDMSDLQIGDVLLDWVDSESSNTLIIWEEISFVNQGYAINLLNDYFTQKYIEYINDSLDKFLFFGTSPDNLSNYLNEANLYIRYDDQFEDSQLASHFIKIMV